MNESLQIPTSLLEAGMDSFEQSKTETRDRLFSCIESYLDNPEYFVGRGSIAKVVTLRVPNGERNLCVKFINTSKTEGTISYTGRERVTPHYIHLRNEAEFLDSLQGIDDSVKVPRPYCFWEKEFVDKGESPEIKSFLLMEQLDAVSLDDVFEYERAPLPESFDVDDFFRKLRVFFEKMHTRNIFHRDVHGGNIMIDKKTGDPRVIDFGSSAFSTPEEAYTEEWKGSVIRFPRDDSALDRLEREVRKSLTNTSVDATFI